MSDASTIVIGADTINIKDSTARSELSNKAAKTEAIKNITRSGITFTATRCDGTTFTFTQQDNDTTTGTTYAAGSVPANTTFATNGSVKNAYDKNHTDITDMTHTIYSNFGGENVGCNLIYDKLNKIVEINAYFSSLNNNQVIVNDTTGLFPTPSSDRELGGVAFGNADGNAWFTKLVIKTNGTIVVTHAVNAGLINCTYNGRIYIG